MVRRHAVTLAFVLGAGAACTPFSAETTPAPTDGGDAATQTSGDGGKGTDASTTARCDLAKPFGTLTPFVTPPASGHGDSAAVLTASGTTMYIASKDAGGQTMLYTAGGSGLGGAWSTPALLGFVSGSGQANNPTLTADQLAIVFNSDRSGSMGKIDLWGATRTSATKPFEAPVALDNVNSADDDFQPWLNAAGDRLYFASNRPLAGSPGTTNIYVVARTGTTLGTVSPVGGLNVGGGAANSESAVLTKDELTVLMSSDRGTPTTSLDVWIAHRKTIGALFDAPQKVPELSTSDDDYPTWVSDDGCDMILERFDGTNATLSFASRPL